MEAYRGSCHCGAVQFTIRTDPGHSVQCDCSLCKRRGSIMLRCDQSDLDIQAGHEMLTEYRFNTGVAIHYFCSRCGVYMFHKMRKLPDKYAVNAGCIEGIDVAELHPILVEGAKA